MVIPILTYLLLYILFVAFVPPEALAAFEAGQVDFWNEAVKKVQQSSYLQIITDFNLNYIVGRYAGLIFEMRLPKILAMFLAGLLCLSARFFPGFIESSAFHSPRPCLRNWF
jgi:hypothetical protein